MSHYDSRKHAQDCLMVRYAALPDDKREYWPAGFSSRPQLCTCGVVANAEAMRPEHARDRQELEEFLDLF